MVRNFKSSDRYMHEFFLPPLLHCGPAYSISIYTHLYAKKSLVSSLNINVIYILPVGTFRGGEEELLLNADIGFWNMNSRRARSCCKNPNPIKTKTEGTFDPRVSSPEICSNCKNWCSLSMKSDPSRARPRDQFS